MRRQFIFLALLIPALISLAEEAPKTIVKGRKMVVVKRGETVEFTGGVTMTRGEDFMSADRMINHEKEGFIEAWGNVYLKRADSARQALSEAWGDEGAYDSNQTSGTLRGNVFIEVHESTPAARLSRGWAGLLSFNSKSGVVRLEQAPATSGPRARFQPPWPPHTAPKPRVVVEETKGRRDLWGDVLTFYEKENSVTSEGAARAYWETMEGGPAVNLPRLIKIKKGGPHGAAR